MPIRKVTPGRKDVLKVEALRARIRAGVDALDRGDFVDIDEADLKSYLEGLNNRPAKGAC